MTVRVGVIGVGMIGQDHIRRLTTVLAGATVVAVSDADGARAAEVAAAVGARALPTGEEVIADAEVDAVLVTSWGATHEQYVLASIAAGKQVFCEKPLAETQDACLRIIEAESAAGTRLVQVGYMRRYDAQYRALKAVVDSGDIGAPLMMHAGHRNPSVPGHYTREHAIVDTAVHDIDVTRWLFGEEIVAATVLTPRKSRHGGDLQDPLLVVLETESGALVDIEVSVNIRYGYDIRGEVIGEDGTVALADSGPVLVRRAASITSAVPADWRERFIRAYDVELQEWIDGVAAGAAPTGPSSWDGYAVSAVADAALEAMNGGVRTTVKLVDKPGLYMTGRVRWGLLSAARIGATVVAANRGSEHTEFVAVAARDAGKARAFAGDNGIPLSFGSYEELFASAEVDAVYVAVPSSMHPRWAIAALRAGKHVLCEKPFATTAADAAAVFDAAEAAGRTCAEAFMYRFHPQTELARRLVADGAIGELRTIRASLTETVPRGDIRWDAGLGGGALLDLGAYCTSAARLFAGTPEQVHAQAFTDGPDGVDHRLVATLRFPGVLALFDIGMDLPRRDELELVGSQGVLTVPDPWVCRATELVLRRDDGVERIPVPRPAGADVAGPDAVYRNEFDRVSAAIAAGEPLPFGRDDAIEQAAVLEALRESVGTRRSAYIRLEVRA